MATMNSADEAAAWAHRNLPAKNTLTAADAKIVEERFQARLSAIGPSQDTCDRPAEGHEPAASGQIGDYVRQARGCGRSGTRAYVRGRAAPACAPLLAHG